MIKIFQINRDRDVNKIVFMAYDWIKDKFDFSIYDEVWKGIVPRDCTLDNIFETFNITHPEDYRGHSLSVSDIVQIIDLNNEEDGYYYCDIFS